MTEGLEGFVAYLFSRQLGYTKEEIDIMCANVRRQMKDPKTHCLFMLYVAPPPPPSR